MLSKVLKIIGLHTKTADPVFHRRQINLSGNLITFSMPENFSRDFPAEDMIEFVDLDNAPGITDYHGAMLLQRFWDFKTDGLFKKDIGTLIMTLSVKKVPDGCQKNLAHPLEFVEVLQQASMGYYLEFNKTVSEEYRYSYLESGNAFFDIIINQHRWTQYFESRDDANSHSACYAIPVTQLYYFVVTFASLPGSAIHIRSFTDHYTDSFITSIMDTFDVFYAAGNHIVNDIRQNKNLKLKQIYDELEAIARKDLPEYIPEPE